MTMMLLLLLLPAPVGSVADAKYDSHYCTMPPSGAPASAPAAGAGPPPARHPAANTTTPAFEIIWNMATEPCRECANASQRTEPQSLGVVTNPNQTFNGAQVACLYRFGLVSPPTQRRCSPAAAGACRLCSDLSLPPRVCPQPPRLKCANLSVWPIPIADITVAQNGGVPQGPGFNLSLHLQRLKEDLDRFIPDPLFSGYALIDKEDWEPMFCSNWVSAGSRYYNVYSEYLVKQAHPGWQNETRISEEAATQWNKAAKSFYLASLAEARRLRPHARWGYFGEPLAPCGLGGSPAHHVSVLASNKRLGWLWQAVDFLAPSIYVHRRPEQQLPKSNYTATLTAWTAMAISHMIALADAASVATGGAHRPKVMPYGSIIYRDLSGAKPPPSVPLPYMIEREALAATIQVPASLGAEGVFLWGSGDDTNICHPDAGCITPICQRCGVVATFLSVGRGGEVMGACIEQREACAQQRCSGHGRCVDRMPLPGGGGIEDLCLPPATGGAGAATGEEQQQQQGGGGGCRCVHGWSGMNCGSVAAAAAEVAM